MSTLLEILCQDVYQNIVATREEVSRCDGVQMIPNGTAPMWKIAGNYVWIAELIAAPPVNAILTDAAKEYFK